MPLQTFHRGLRDVKISSWTSENSYGTAYDVLGARELSLEWVLETDELRGDDVVLDRFSKLVSVTFRLANAAVDLNLLDILLGGTLTSTADYEDFMIGESDEIPYVAIAGRVAGSGGNGDLHAFIPKAKISGNLQYAAQENTYLIPQAQFQGIHEGTANGMLRFRNFTEPTALEIPLRTTKGFA